MQNNRKNDNSAKSHKKVPPQGLEPWTRGLRVRCSSQLSYGGDNQDCSTGFSFYTTLGRNVVGASVRRMFATLEPVFKEMALTVTVRFENFLRSSSVRVEGDFTTFTINSLRFAPSDFAWPAA